MSRLVPCLALWLVLVPVGAQAIQLRWNSGATDLTFMEATRCTLVVQADSAEVTLPSQWRLLWVADTSAVQFTPLDSLLACQADTAQVSGIDGPSTPADSAANLITAHFCSGGETAASAASYLIDLPGNTHGRLKVVALDPADSSQVVESNDATWNGGIEAEYSPAILWASRSHPSTQLLVKAVGVGLANAPRVEIAAPDASWRLALNVTEQSDTALTAVAQVAADLPPSVLQVGRVSGGIGTASLEADTASELVAQVPCVTFMREYDPDGHAYIQPKDFAVVASRDSFHIFYIRHDMRITNGNLNEKTLGHKRSWRDLNSWDPRSGTMIALEARPGQWDNHHVWAPCIVKKPNDITYWMFYTGVKDTTDQGLRTQVQRIGVATSTDLNVWTPEDTWVYSHNNAQDWAEQDSAYSSGQQFRDPFVMEDPDSAGHYLMFFVAGSKDRKPRLVVGAARTQTRGSVVDDFHYWEDVGALWNTDSVTTGGPIVESPHVFADPGGRWCLYFTSAVSYADSAFVCFETNDVSPVDADTTRWSTPPDTLYKFLGGDPVVQQWIASEYLKWAPGYEYLLAMDDHQLAVDLAQVSWHGPHVFALNDSCAPSAPLGVDPGRGLRFALSVHGMHPARGWVSFGVETPSRTHVCLAVYDVQGRRVRTLLDGEVPPGQQVVRWDGRGAGGKAVGSGIYFARLTSSSGQRVARVVLLR